MFAWGYYWGLTPTISPSPQDFRPPLSWSLPIVNALNPPHYFSIAVTTGSTSKVLVDYMSQVSYPIAFMFWLTLPLCLWFILKKKDESSFALLYMTWSLSTYLPWILFGAFIQTMTFNYYLIYTTPILAMGLPYFWSRMPLSDKNKLVFALMHLAITIAFFCAYFPVVLFR